MTASGPRRRLLIVDDEEAMRLLLAKFVQQDLGAEVTLAGTCEAALRLARAAPYDAILLDLMMPGVGGVEVLRQIRADSANRSTPVVIVSVLVKDPETGEPLTEQRKALGANAFLPKPVDRSALAATLRAQWVAP
jgi:CheY-like chemotaxis protein